MISTSLSNDSRVDRVVVVLAGDLDPPGALVAHGMVRAVVTERELHGAATEREAEDLVAEADAEERHAAADQALHRFDRRR